MKLYWNSRSYLCLTLEIHVFWTVIVQTCSCVVIVCITFIFLLLISPLSSPSSFMKISFQRFCLILFCSFNSAVYSERYEDKQNCSPKTVDWVVQLKDAITSCLCRKHLAKVHHPHTARSLSWSLFKGRDSGFIEEGRLQLPNATLSTFNVLHWGRSQALGSHYLFVGVKPVHPNSQAQYIDSYLITEQFILNWSPITAF